MPLPCLKGTYGYNQQAGQQAMLQLQLLYIYAAHEPSTLNNESLNMQNAWLLFHGLLAMSMAAAAR